MSARLKPGGMAYFSALLLSLTVFYIPIALKAESIWGDSLERKNRGVAGLPQNPHVSIDYSTYPDFNELTDILKKCRERSSRRIYKPLPFPRDLGIALLCFTRLPAIAHRYLEKAQLF